MAGGAEGEESCRELLVLDGSLPAAAEHPKVARQRRLQLLAGVLLGTLALVFVGVCGYWVGRPKALGGANAFLGLGEDDNCEAYFHKGLDCFQKPNWECVKNDGSWGYACCCFHGWGDLSNTEQETTGMLSSAAHPGMCIDWSTSYSIGAKYSDGSAYMDNCFFGNPNKHFRLQTSGKGMIHWATHPKFCLAVKEGDNSVGAALGLQRCWQVPENWTNFAMLHIEGSGGASLIRWEAHKDKCLKIGDKAGGSKIGLAYCKDDDELQQFKVKELLGPPSKDDYPRLFCVSLMLPFGAELHLMRAQYWKKVGIFLCEDSAVYSNESLKLWRHKDFIYTDIMPGSMVVKFGGKWHSALNTDIFIRFWAKIIKDERAWRNHWTVKVDPDAVFFPDRLQQVARSLWRDGDAKKPVFLNNCHLGMHGPIEVISRHGLGIYKDRWRECKNGAPYEHKQEDFYYRRCWEMLGVEKVDAYNLLFENEYACDERPETRDGRHPCFSKQVAFHPFKTPDSYMSCHSRGKAMKWSTPLMANHRVPTEENLKFES